MWATGAMEALLQGPKSAAAVDENAGRLLKHSTRQAPELLLVEVDGRVIDSLGWPVAGARIASASEGGEAVSSDSEGNFILQVLAGRQHLLTATAEGMGRSSALAIPGEPALLILTTEFPWSTGEAQIEAAPAEEAEPADEGTLLAGEGFLVDQAGRELAKAIVLVEETGERVRADEYGRFRVPLPAESCSILAYDAEGRVGHMAFKPSRSQGVMPLGEIHLNYGLELAGILHDKDRAPAQIAALELRRNGMHRRQFTDASGRFAFRGLLPGEYELIAYPHRGDLGFRQLITLKGSMDADWKLEASRSLRIQVLEQTAGPQALAHVRLDAEGIGSRYAQADSEGYVLFEGLGTGPFAFEVRDPDFGAMQVLSYQAEVAKLMVASSASPKER